jgi:CHAD domain-containing protein
VIETKIKANSNRHLRHPPQALFLALRRVLKGQACARKEPAVDAIHDLRVALRRARSLAEGFSELDPHPGWRHLRKACKQLQGKLAELRDLQVMLGWVGRLHMDQAAGGEALAEELDRQERKARHKARAAIQSFSRKRWKEWKRRLPERAETLPFGDAHFAGLALRRLKDVQNLERQRRRNPSRLALHRLRVGVKRFRYTVEAFLPEKHVVWGKTLRRMQGLLGEIHDLDVLRAKLTELARDKQQHAGAGRKEASTETQLAPIERSREERIAAYDKLTAPRLRADGSKIPESSVWDRWQRELEDLIGINLPESAAPSRARARRGRRSTAKASPVRGRRLRLS